MEEHVPLASLTTFRLGGPARYLARVHDDAGLLDALKFAKANALPLLILGGGSNMLIGDHGYEGLVIRMEGGNIEWTDEGESVRVAADAGVVWDDLVQASVERGLFGIENLSAIPGTVGAAPIQNIGAYGTEAANVIECVEAIDRETCERVRLSHDACMFGYRDSIFKQKEGERFIVTRVIFRLVRSGHVNISYLDIARFFDGSDVNTIDLKDVRNAVREIRAKKFPSLAEIGTAGSFFKNPILDVENAEKLKARYPELPIYAAGPGKAKISAAFLIDRIAGFRGVRRGDVGSWHAQALVLVNFGHATAREVASFADEIRDRVRELTDVIIEPEVVHCNVDQK